MIILQEQITDMIHTERQIDCTEQNSTDEKEVKVKKEYSNKVIQNQEQLEIHFSLGAYS